MISLRKFAKQRGVALAAVQKAIASGRISAESIERNAKGRICGIDPERANREWDEHTDPGEAAKSGKIIVPPTVLPVPASAVEEGAQLELGDAEPRGDEPGGVDGVPADGPLTEGYQAARARREHFAARKAELDYMERIGRVGSVAEFAEAALELGRFFQDELIGISARISSQLAAEPDPVKVDALLSAEHRRVLNAVADRAQRLAVARGAGERVAGDV